MSFHNPLQIKEGSIFWRFYCKRYEIAGKPVPRPTSLCPYFWTAVSGFRLWVRHQVPLTRLWLVALAATAGVLGAAKLATPDTTLGGVIVVASVFAWLPAFLTAGITTVSRGAQALEKWIMASPRAQITLGVLIFGGLFGFIAYGAITSGAGSHGPGFAQLAAEFWRDMKGLLILFGYLAGGLFIITTAQVALKRFRRTNIAVSTVLLGAFLYGFIRIAWERVFGPMLMRDFGPDGLKWFGIIVGALLALAGLVAGSVYLLRRIPSRAKETVSDGVDTVIAFAKATKDQVCPPVQAPASFKETPDTK